MRAPHIIATTPRRLVPALQAVGLATVLVLASGCSVGSSKEASDPTTTCNDPRKPFARQSWVTSGEIEDIAVHCNTIFVAGDLGTIGQRSGPLASVSTHTAQRETLLPELSGDVGDAEEQRSPVRALAADGFGGWFVAGSFSHADGKACAALVHVRRGGRLDSGFCPRPNGAVRALLRLGNTLYFGGSFTRVGNDKRLGLAAMQIATGEVLPWAPHLAPAERYQDRGGSTDRIAMISALVGDASTVYVGGFFGGIDGASRRHLAAVDPSSGRVLPFDAHLGDPSYFEDLLNVGGVEALALTANSVFVACPSCSRVGSPSLLTVDRESGSPLHPQIPIAGAVLTLLKHGSTLYIGGAFDRIDGAPRSNAGALDLASHRLLPWRPVVSRPNSFYDGVRAILKDGARVYLGGSFRRAGGKPHRYVAAFDARSGRALSWDPQVDGPVLALGATPATVILGGRLGSINAEPRTSLAAIDGPTRRLLSWSPRVKGRYGSGGVNALLVFESSLYVGGNFSRIDGQPRRSLAAFEVSSGRLDDWRPAVGGDPTYGVTTITSGGERVYVGGDFSRINGESRVGVGALETGTGELSDWAPAPDNGADSVHVHAIADSGDRIYIGGEFEEVAGSPHAGAVAVDRETGDASDWNPAPDDLGFVYALAASDTQVHLGGWFERVGSAARTGLAQVDRSTGTATSFDAHLVGGEISTDVKSIVRRGGWLFVGGDFDRVDGKKRNGLAVVSAETGRVLPWHLDPSGGFEWVNEIEVAGRTVIAGGYAGGGNSHQLIVASLAQ